MRFTTREVRKTTHGFLIRQVYVSSGIGLPSGWKISVALVSEVLTVIDVKFQFLELLNEQLSLFPAVAQ